MPPPKKNKMTRKKREKNRKGKRKGNCESEMGSLGAPPTLPPNHWPCQIAFHSRSTTPAPMWTSFLTPLVPQIWIYATPVVKMVFNLTFVLSLLISNHLHTSTLIHDDAVFNKSFRNDTISFALSYILISRQKMPQAKTIHHELVFNI